MLESDRYELIDCVRNPREPKYIELKQQEIDLIEERLSRKQQLSPPRSNRFQFIEFNQSQEIEDDNAIIKRKEAAQRERN